MRIIVLSDAGFFIAYVNPTSRGKMVKTSCNKRKENIRGNIGGKEIKANQQHRGIFRSEVRNYRCLKIRATRPMALCQTQEVSAIRDRQHCGLKEQI